MLFKRLHACKMKSSILCHLNLRSFDSRQASLHRRRKSSEDKSAETTKSPKNKNKEKKRKGFLIH